MRDPRLMLACLLVFGTAATAAAQPRAPAYHTNHGTTLNVFGGVATASSDTGGLFGGAAGWEITPWFGIEGDAAWLDRPDGEEGFKGALSVHANLLGRHTVVPFLKGGFGLYHAAFASAGQVTPHFYRRRLDAATTVPETNQSFTDPTFVAGGGVNVFLSSHVALRPQVEAIIAVRDSQSYVVTAFTLHLAYHFEEHPITPGRATR